MILCGQAGRRRAGREVVLAGVGYAQWVLREHRTRKDVKHELVVGKMAY